MDKRLYRLLMWCAAGLTAAWISWSFYDGFIESAQPGDRPYLAGNRAFEDGHYDRALAAYQEALNEDPDHVFAHRGKARSLMQLNRDSEAMDLFNEIIAREPGFAPSFANRGILHDRMGHYQEAIRDYETALRLDPDIDKGPHWLTRFLRLQPEKPPSIGDRAQYLKQQLAKPETERLLRVPDLDQKQRPYNQ